MNKKLIYTLKVSLWTFLAMNCISCAHQSKDMSLMIDKEAPSEDHVWSESRDVEQATAEQKQTSEESELETVAQGETEEQSTESLSQSNELVAPSSEVNLASNDEQTSPTVDTQAESSLDHNLKSESPREVATEPPVEEVTPPSQVEPTIGVPGRLKNNDEGAPGKKSIEKSRSSNNRNNLSDSKPITLEKVPAPEKEPVVELVTDPNMLERVVPDPSAPTLNALGEEEESSPQLASVEIATFVRHHWAVTLVLAVGLMGALYFVLGRRRNQNTESI